MWNFNQQKLQNSRKQEVAFRCQICVQITLRKFKNANKCVHPFCTTCIIKYIKVKLAAGNVLDIKCPAYNCNLSLEPLSCRPIITRELFIKWCDALSEKAVSKVDRAYCPNYKCSALILNECARAGTLKRCVCPYCKQAFCFKCEVPWHAGFSCDQNRMIKRNVNDGAFFSLSEKKGWSRCPGCMYFVERISGCDHIKCRCGIKFNYNNPVAISPPRTTQDEGGYVIVFIIFLIPLLVLFIGILSTIYATGGEE